MVSIDQLHTKNTNGELTRENGYFYGDYSFVKHEGLWWTEAEKLGRLVKIPLHFGPRDVDFIEIEGNLEPEFNDQQEVYVAIDPTIANKFYTLAASELAQNVGTGINRIPVGACIKEDEICVDREILDCDNTQGKPVIEIALSDKPEIKLSGTCIKVAGKDYNLIRAIDRLLLNWYGIM